MTDRSLTELELGLTELVKYINYNSACNKVISDIDIQDSTNLDSLSELVGISNSFRRKKVFEYNSYIITLYGLFERYLENVLEDYLTDICSLLKDFDKLPSELKTNLLDANVDILRNLTNPKFQNISKEGFIRNIHEALNENKAVINIEAFQHHPYNFKQNIVSDFFNKIGIKGLSSDLKAYEPLRELLTIKYGNPANIQSGVLFHVIDDLSQRRNDVAHGVENIELLNTSIIMEYIEFLGAYCKSLFNILKNERNSYLFNNKEVNFGLISVINNSIVCGTLSSISISKSDCVLIEKSESNRPRYEILKIKNIQVDQVNYERLTISENTNVGLELDNFVKDNYNFKVIASSDGL